MTNQEQSRLMDCQAKVTALQKELHEAMSENARLAAAVRSMGNGGFTMTGYASFADKTLSGSGKALRDLLAPTIELLEQHTFDEHGQPYQSPNESRIESELARLRAVCGEKQK